MNESNEEASYPPPLKVSDDQFDLWLQNQARELKLVEKKLDSDVKLEKQRLANEAEEQKIQSRQNELEVSLAKISLQNDESKNARFYKYGIAVFVLITILAGYSLYLGKEALVKEAVKLLGVLGAGWIGGYHWGKRSCGE